MLPQSWRECFKHSNLINAQLKVSPEAFLELLELTFEPLVVEGTSFFLGIRQYLTVFWSRIVYSESL